MLFSQIPGQQELKANLLKTIAQGKLPHALMFLGGQGSPNLAMAMALAQYVNCQNPTPNDSCGTCASCRFTQKLAHPEIHFTFPTIGKDVVSVELLPHFRQAAGQNLYLKEYDWLKHIEGDNKQGNINKKECIEIIKFTSLKTNANYKIVIIWKPERLSTQGNILLKTIEEPPAKTLIIFVANDTENILGTILSRVQIYPMQPVSIDNMASFAKSQFELDETHAKQMAFAANGNVGKLFDLIETKNESQNEVLLADWIRFNVKSEPVALNKWVDEMAKQGREAQKNFIDYALIFFQNALQLSWNPVAKSRFSEREAKMANYVIKQLSYNHLNSWVETLEKAHYYIERNVHSKILFMNLSIHLNKMLTKQSVVK